MRKWIVVVAAAAAAACAEKDEKRVAGRTASATSAPVATVTLSVRRERVTDAATARATGRVEVLAEVAGATGAALVTPGGEVVPLEVEGAGFALRLEGPAEPLAARFASGGYTLVADLPGRDATATVVAGGWPAAPVIVAPRDLEPVPAGDLLVRWEGAGACDVRVVDPLQGRVAWSGRDLPGPEVRVPRAALGSARRLRVEVLAADGAAARTAAGSAVLVDVAP